MAITNQNFFAQLIADVNISHGELRITIKQDNALGRCCFASPPMSSPRRNSLRKGRWEDSNECTSSSAAEAASSSSACSGNSNPSQSTASSRRSACPPSPPIRTGAATRKLLASKAVKLAPRFEDKRWENETPALLMRKEQAPSLPRRHYEA